MILQPSLFDPPARVAPLIEVLHEPDEALDTRFNRWLAANPQALAAFIGIAEEARAHGVMRIGAKLIVEELRWRYAIQTRGDDYKFNNSFTSRLARVAANTRPDLADLFEFRNLRS